MTQGNCIYYDDMEMKLFKGEMANFALSPFYVTRDRKYIPTDLINMDADIDYDCLKSDTVIRN